MADPVGNSVEVKVHDDAQQEVSLNAGAELDDELANAGPPHEELFGDFTAGEVPDLKKDVVLIQALEAQLQDLTYLRDDLVRARGMNQSFALEAQRLLPGFDGDAPLGFYTAETSATRYHVSLEEVSRGIWVAIAAIAAALVAALVKLIQWIGSRRSTSSGPDVAQQAKDNLAKLDETHQRTEEIKQAISSGHTTTLNKDGEPEKLITMTSLIEDTWTDQTRYEKALKFLRLEDPILRDIVLGGSYSQTAHELMHGFGAVAATLETKIRELDKIAKIDRNSFRESDRLANAHVLEIIGRPVQLRLHGRECSLIEAADRLAATRVAIKDSAQHQQELTFDHMVQAVVGAYRTADLAKFFQEQAYIAGVFARMKDTLEHVKNTVGDLSKDGQVSHNTEGMGGLIREVLMAVSKDVSGYDRLYSELKGYGTHLDLLATQTIGFANELEAQLFAMARRGQIKLPEGWQEKGNRDRIDKISALFGKPRNK